MDIRKLAEEVIVKKYSIAKSADFVEIGIGAVNVVNMCNSGYLGRLRHVYYELAEKT